MSATVAFSLIAVWVSVAAVANNLSSLVIYNQSLVRYGGATAAKLVDGEWWRVFSSQLLHVYFFHALLNAIAILVVGSYVERLIGSGRLAAVLLCAGITGVLVAVATAPALVASGASHAALGVSGTGAMLGARYKQRALGLSAVGYITIQVLLDIIFAGMVKMPHACSAIVGLLFGTMLHRRDFLAN